MRFLLVDLESAFWAPALGGMPAHDVPRAVVRSIREIGKGFDRIICAAGGCEEGGRPCTGPSFRSIAWPSYKADRKDRGEDKWNALASLITDCRAEGWPVYEAPLCDTAESDQRAVFYEADDVLGTMAAYLSGRGHEVVIYSSDSDLCQCVGPLVRQLRKLKTGDLSLMDEKGVEAWLEVPPSLVCEVKALAGDGDGYKPFEGIGPKTAIKALRSVAEPTARAVVDHSLSIAEDKRSAGQRAFAAGAANLARAYLAARIVTDVPIDLASLEAQPVRQPPRDVTSGMIPDGEIEDAPGEHAPIQPSAGLVLSDMSARMLAPAEEAHSRMIEFRAFVSRCMVRDVDYGKIPGTDKDTLFKPGAEKLAEIYGFAATFEIEKAIERWDANPLFFYRVRCRLVRKGDDKLIAECIGSCNSWESKYRDRWAWESEVPADLDKSRLETKTFQGRNGKQNTKFKVPNPSPFDQVNTVLKMAEKRAMVGAVILATRSGGVFAQDLDDVPAAAFGQASDSRQWDHV